MDKDFRKRCRKHLQRTITWILQSEEIDSGTKTFYTELEKRVLEGKEVKKWFEMKRGGGRLNPWPRAG